MLQDFVRSNREELVSRARAKASARSSDPAPTGEPEHGVPLFLTQCSDALRPETRSAPFPPTFVAAGAATHGRALLALGFTIAQVVHEYADVRQAITELAIDRRTTFSPEELHALNGCLDTAIAEAVTAYERVKEEAVSQQELRHRGAIAHDLRNHVQTAMLSFRVVEKVLEAGEVSAVGSSARMLGRSLVSIRDLADGILAEVHLARR